MASVAPPQDLAAEDAVLGTVLLGPAVLASMLGPEHGLRPEHFYRENNGQVFACMVGLHERGEPVDTITLKAECKRIGLNAGSIVDGASGAVPNVGNWRGYVKAVKDTHRRRQVLEASTLLRDAATLDQPAKIAEADRLLAQQDSNASVYTPERQAEDFLDGNLAPILCPWPWERLNKITGGGLRAAQTTFVGAWTNHGKSPIVDDILLTGKARGLRTALYINEMGERERTQRIGAYLTDVSFERIRDEGLSPSERMRVANALSDRSIPILNVADWDVDAVCRDIARSGWQMAGVDILHEFEYSDEGDLRRMGSALARCAKRTGCHIVIAVHLNEARALGGELPPPVLRDIRGSGMLKNSADHVLFLWRETSEDGFPQENARIYFAKARNSALGGVSLRFDHRHMRFVAA